MPRWQAPADVMPLRLFAANDAANRDPRQVQLARDPLDAPVLDQKSVPDFADRRHCQHPPAEIPCKRAPEAIFKLKRVGSKLHAGSQNEVACVT